MTGVLLSQLSNSQALITARISASLKTEFVFISRSLKHTHFLYERLTNRFKSTYYQVNKKQQKRSRGESKKRKTCRFLSFTFTTQKRSCSKRERHRTAVLKQKILVKRMTSKLLHIEAAYSLTTVSRKMKLSKVLNNYRLFHWICFHDQRGFAVRNKLLKHFTEVMRHLLTDKNTYPLDRSLNHCPLRASVIVQKMAFLIISDT